LLIALFQRFRLELDVLLACGFLLPIFANPGFEAFAGCGVAAGEGQRGNIGIGNRDLLV
jgi:hypothetical protein